MKKQNVLVPVTEKYHKNKTCIMKKNLQSKLILGGGVKVKGGRFISLGDNFLKHPVSISNGSIRPWIHRVHMT